MSEPTLALIGYYLGLGFAVLLVWAACLPDAQPDHGRVARTVRRSRRAAVVGILHPAVALAARDLIGQAGIDLADREADLVGTVDRAASLAGACVVLSAVIAVAVLVATALA